MSNLPATSQSFELHSNAMAIKGSLDIEDWIDLGEMLKRMHGGVQWWLGDWLNYGERHYGERYSQALDASDYEFDTLRGFAWVSKKISPDRRRPGLSWSIHKEVAGLEPDQQDFWLDHAETEGWTVRELRKEMRGLPAAGAEKFSGLLVGRSAGDTVVIAVDDCERFLERLSEASKASIEVREA